MGNSSSNNDNSRHDSGGRERRNRRYYTAHGIEYLPVKASQLQRLRAAQQGMARKARGRTRSRNEDRDYAKRTINVDLTHTDGGYALQNGKVTTDAEKLHVETVAMQLPSVTSNGNLVSFPLDIESEESSVESVDYTPGRIESTLCNALMVSQDWTEAIAAQRMMKNSGGKEHLQWLHARNSYPFENVVLSGGGSKGYAYIGALKALEDAGVIQNIKRVGGSSAGAICGGLLAVGCSAQDIADVFKGDIKHIFQDQTCAFCCCLPKICRTYGVHPAKRFLKIYGQHVAAKVGNPDITFKELYEKHGRELCIVVTNLSKMCSEYCHYKTTPDLPIRMAVRMSMSFPMVYEAVKININGQESLYTDGGTLDQFPVHCFDDPELELNHNSKKTEDTVFNEKTVGLYLVSESAIDYKIWKALFDCEIPHKPTYMPDTKIARQRLQEEFERRKRKTPEVTLKEFLSQLSEEAQKDSAQPMFHYETCDRSVVDIRNFKDYFVTTIETLLINQRRLHVKIKDKERTVAINCGYIGTNDYVLEPGDREFMIRQGYECTKKFLADFRQRQADVQKIEEEDSAVHSSSSCHDTFLTNQCDNTVTANPLKVRCETDITLSISPDDHDTHSANQKASLHPDCDSVRTLNFPFIDE